MLRNLLITPKRILIALVCLTIITSCKQENSKNTKVSIENNNASTSYSYTFDNGTTKAEVTVSRTPERAVIFSQFLTEMLLALGLEDNIILGTSEGEIHESLRVAYDKIPNKMQGHHSMISKEAFLLLNPDFVSGWSDAIKPQTTGDAQELLQNNIYPYVLNSIKSDATLETVYSDFIELGKIFNVEDQANTLVKELKDKLAEAKTSFKTALENKKVKAVVMGTLDNGAYVASALVSNLIEEANGVNIYKELTNNYEMVSYESIVEKDPDIIFVYVTADGVSGEDKINFLKNHPALKNVSAIKNNNIHALLLANVAPGIRNIDVIIKMNKLFYK